MPETDMMTLLQLIEQCDSVRMTKFVKDLSAVVREAGKRSPEFEILWGLVSVLLTIVMTHKTKDERIDVLAQVQAMIALSMGLGEVNAAKSDPSLH